MKAILNADSMVCFGDSWNDLPMFSVADESYAVKNAVEELKKVATGIIGYSEEDAVCKFLMQRMRM